MAIKNTKYLPFLLTLIASWSAKKQRYIKHQDIKH